MKLCVNCKFFESRLVNNETMRLDSCNHPQNFFLDPVRGGTYQRHPSWLRMMPDNVKKCGADADWFELKDT